MQALSSTNLVDAIMYETAWYFNNCPVSYISVTLTCMYSYSYVFVLVCKCTSHLYYSSFVCAFQCLIKVPRTLLEMFDQDMIKFWCKNCNELSSNDFLFRFCSKNYFPRPNAHFRPCFALLLGLVLEITLDPRLLRPPVYYTLKSTRMKGNRGDRFGVWRPGGYFCRHPASIENLLRCLAYVLTMAFGVSKPHFLASSVYRVTFPGVSRP